MLDLMLGPLWPYIAGAGAALVAWGAYTLRLRKARQEGVQKATEAAKGKDRERARQVQDAADAARDIHSDDPVGRLRKSGLIRDRD